MDVVEVEGEWDHAIPEIDVMRTLGPSYETRRVMQNLAIVSQLIAIRDLQEAGDTPDRIAGNGFSGR